MFEFNTFRFYRLLPVDIRFSFRISFNILLHVISPLMPTFSSHQEYSYSVAQCQQGSWCSQEWMACNHPVVGTRWEYLYVVVLGPEAELETQTHLLNVLRLNSNNFDCVAIN